MTFVWTKFLASVCLIIFRSSAYLPYGCFIWKTNHLPFVYKSRKSQVKPIYLFFITKLTTFTWGPTLTRARHVYCTVARPAITYGSAVWYSPPGAKEIRKGSEDKLAVIQKKCLRVVAGAYRATPIEVLHAEAMVPPMKEHLDQLQAKIRTRFETSGQVAFV